jgi:hypothetical protein
MTAGPSSDRVRSVAAMFEEPVKVPSPDVPSLSVRWEGLVVVIDATTLNTVVRRALRRVPEVDDVLVEPEEGRLSLTIWFKKGFRMPLRSRVANIRFRDGWLGFSLEKLTAFGFLPIPAWVIRRIVRHLPPGFAFFYRAGRVVVLNLTTLFPPELSLIVREVVFEPGEIRAIFGPSRYRLDRLFDVLEKDPFDLD